MVEMCGLAVSSKAGVHGPKVKAGDGAGVVASGPGTVVCGIRAERGHVRVEGKWWGGLGVERGGVTAEGRPSPV